MPSAFGWQRRELRLIRVASHTQTRRRAPRAQSFKVTQDPVSEESPPQADQVIPIETYKQEHAKDQALTAARLALQDKSNKKRRLVIGRVMLF